MTTEIIKGIIAVVIIVGAIVSIFIDNAIVAREFLIPLASFAFGYYFKQSGQQVTMRLKAAFKKE